MKVNYVTLSRKFLQTESEGNELYQKRLTDENTCLLRLDPDAEPFFVCINNEIACLVERIWKVNSRLQQLIEKIPARSILLQSALYREIELSNEIEGIHSSRKTLKEAAQKSSGRFFGQISQYGKILQDATPEFPCAIAEIREYYDELLYKEIQMDNPDNLPDGKMFRKDPVFISDGFKNRHTGVTPEDKIESMLQSSLNWMRHHTVPDLVAIAVFHYIFGYIHPFYDGNGRLNRFLTTVFLANDLGPSASLLLSTALSRHRSDYYKAFEVCEDPLNHNELTYFVLFFLNCLSEAVEDEFQILDEKWDEFTKFSESLKKMDLKSRDSQILQLLGESELFGEDGLIKEELAEKLGCSVSTVRNLVKEHKSRIFTTKEGRYNLYRLDRRFLKEMTE